MSSNKTPLAKVTLSLFVGMMFWSSWSLQSAWRALPFTAKNHARVTGLPTPEAQRKLELSQRLSKAATAPSQLKKEDAAALKAAFGSDSSKMLELLRQSAD